MTLLNSDKSEYYEYVWMCLCWAGVCMCVWMQGTSKQIVVNRYLGNAWHFSRVKKKESSKPGHPLSGGSVFKHAGTKGSEFGCLTWSS